VKADPVKVAKAGEKKTDSQSTKQPAKNLQEKTEANKGESVGTATKQEPLDSAATQKPKESKGK